MGSTQERESKGCGVAAELFQGRLARRDVVRENALMFRKYLIDLLTNEPRSVSSVARELGLRRAHVEDDLRHAIRSARAQGQKVQVLPARCKTCDFVFGEEKLSKPSRCPACKGTRLFEPMIRISADSQ
jgi:transcriptional regulator